MTPVDVQFKFRLEPAAAEVIPVEPFTVNVTFGVVTGDVVHVVVPPVVTQETFAGSTRTSKRAVFQTSPFEQ